MTERHDDKHELKGPHPTPDLNGAVLLGKPDPKDFTLACQGTCLDLHAFAGQVSMGMARALAGKANADKQAEASGRVMAADGLGGIMQAVRHIAAVLKVQVQINPNPEAQRGQG